jgi:Flp pilus assembly protein TadG
MAMPLLLALTLGLLWLLTLGTAQVRLVDATREAARALARGDTQAEALDLAQQVAPAGAELSVTADGELVVVAGTVRVDGVAGLFEALPSVQLTADATAAREVPP